MSQRVEVEVGSDGEFRMEFVGFAGDDCYAEAERIRSSLAELGVRVGTIEVQPKPGGLIEAEMGIEEDSEGDVPAKRG
ncbi:MAG: hypothetical protein ACLFS8_06930 [Clostridia bacterium]